jgi:VIT1/CCC1 family predicted Fe2+/Mn2+ transporter
VIDTASQPGSAARSRSPGTIHLSHRAGWLRAAVLGANDGIVSTASLVLGVAAAGQSTSAIVTAGIAGLVAGALSMAAGEYVSVSSQRDAEQADILLEARELRADPEGELRELAAIYERRGLPAELAQSVAEALSARGALTAHLRDELGLSEERLARPLQAAWASALSFSAGAVIPLLAIALIGGAARVALCILTTTLALACLGFLGAHLGGAPAARAAGRVVVWGLIAMGATAAIGALVGTVV